MIRIARMQYCDCPVIDKLHLLVKRDEVPMSPREAVAISYTWGKFNRRDVKLGHDHMDEHVFLNIGDEWDINELQACLVKLTNEYGGCWIDQLCIPQETEAIRAALAKTPAVYRNLEVIALMPGSTCECIGKMKKILQAFNEGKRAESLQKVTDDVKRELADCLNSAGLNAWFSRLWPRQEFMYSRRIHIRRTSNIINRCVKCKDDADDLGVYANLLFKKKKEKGYSPDDAFYAVKSANSFFLGTAATDVREYLPLESEDKVAVAFAQFLLGEVIENKQPLYDQEDIQGRLEAFLSQLGRLSRLSRKATNLWDYVISVWVDCPGYEVPPDPKAMSIQELLEDAITQLERKLGLSPASYAPAGLFGVRDAGALWRPTADLDLPLHFSTRHIYGALCPSHSVPVYQGSIPIQSIGQPCMPLSARSEDYIHKFDSWNTAAVFDALRRITEQFPEEILARFFAVKLIDDHRVLATTPPGNYLLDHIFEELLLPSSRSRGRRNVWSLPEINHHEVVYKMVTTALGLSKSKCQEKGLRLAISLEDPPCLGLMKSEFCNQVFESHVATRRWKSRIQEYPLVTVCTSKDSEELGCALIEAAILQTGPPALLEVAGVWVPMKLTPFYHINCMAVDAARDGRLGGPFEIETVQPPEPDGSNSEISESNQHQRHAAGLRQATQVAATLYVLLIVGSLLVWTLSNGQNRI
jgi:hypothetical protein